MRQGCQAMLQRRLITILLVTFLQEQRFFAMIVFRTGGNTTREAFARIQNGMTESEVEGFLVGSRLLRPCQLFSLQGCFPGVCGECTARLRRSLSRSMKGKCAISGWGRQFSVWQAAVDSRPLWRFGVWSFYDTRDPRPCQVVAMKRELVARVAEARNAEWEGGGKSRKVGLDSDVLCHYRAPILSRPFCLF